MAQTQASSRSVFHAPPQGAAGSRVQDATTNRRKRRPRKLSARSLENAAYRHLQRYTSSRANLVRVLLRRVDRSVREHGGQREDWLDAVEQAVRKMEAAGLIDDAAYAKMLAQSLTRRGKALRVVRARLKEKGIEEALIHQTLTALREELAVASGDDPDLCAAVELARRKRLGAFGPNDHRQTRYRRHLAVLARAGFSFSVAKRVLQADDPEALLAPLSPFT